MQANEAEKIRDRQMHCGTAGATPGCKVTQRYLFQVLRGLPKEIVYAQMLLGFELAMADPRFVGLNMVMPEDYYVPMHDFPLHMRMMQYLHSQYPSVHVTLHAGELVEGLVPPEGLRFHVRDSVEMAGAERIGHGVDAINETSSVELLERDGEEERDGGDLPHQQRRDPRRAGTQSPPARLHARGRSGCARDG